MESPQPCALGRDGVLRLVRRPRLRFDRMLREGTVFHMLSSLDELGRTGFTAIASTAAEAEALYENTRATLLEEAELAAATRPGSRPSSAQMSTGGGSRVLVALGAGNA